MANLHTAGLGEICVASNECLFLPLLSYSIGCAKAFGPAAGSAKGLPIFQYHGLWLCKLYLHLIPLVHARCNRCIVADLSCDCEACSLDAPGVVTPDTAPDISEPT